MVRSQSIFIIDCFLKQYQRYLVPGALSMISCFLPGALSFPSQAPEIILTKSYDETLCDMWSVGVILFECLCGRAPFASRTYDELLDKIQASEPIQVTSEPVQVTSEPIQVTSELGTDRTFGSDSVRYGDPVYFGRFGFGSDSVGSYRTYAESGARVWQKYQQFRCNNLLIFE